MTSVAEAYLRQFHASQTGSTRRAFGRHPARCAKIEFPSSYHVLAAEVPNDAVPRTVLDLACGDGPLLQILNERGHPETRLIGIDLSDDELAAARIILPPTVQLLKERAQAISLESGSVDYLLSHMALMLMDDIEQVIREMQRVLQCGGSFAAIVGRAFLSGEIGEIFLDIFRPLAKKHLPPLPMGDPRTRDVAGWEQLLRDGFTQVTTDDIDVAWRPTPQQLWTSIQETYDVDRMTDPVRERFRDELLRAVAPFTDEDDTLETGWALRLVRAKVVDCMGL